MKTIEEFYKEIAGSVELQNELKTASNEMLGAFLKKHGCDADVKRFMTLLRSQNEGEIEDENAETIAGGGKWQYLGLNRRDREFSDTE